MIDFTLKYCVYVTRYDKLFYIGKSKTDSVLSKNYKGSGYALHDAFKKYPKQKWSTDIIATFENEQDAYDLEKILVTDELISDENNLNLVIGGAGGRPWNQHSLLSRGKKISFALKGKKRGNQSKETIDKRIQTFKNEDVKKKLGHSRGKKRLDFTAERKKEYSERIKNITAKIFNSEESVYKRKIKELNKIIKEKNRDVRISNGRLKTQKTLACRGRRGTTDKPIFVDGKKFPSRIAAMEFYSFRHFYQLVTKHKVTDDKFAFFIDKCKVKTMALSGC